MWLTRPWRSSTVGTLMACGKRRSRRSRILRGPQFGFSRLAATMAASPAPATGWRMRCGSPHRTLREQSRRRLTSAHPPKGTANAPIQIGWPSPTVSLPPRCRPESFPSRTPFTEIDESPTLASAILRGLADSDSGLRQLQDNRP